MPPSTSRGAWRPSWLPRWCRGSQLGVGVAAAGLRQAGEITLDVGHEDRHADGAKVFGQCLQAYRLAGAGGARDEAMAVRHLWQQATLGVAVLGDQQAIGQG